MTNGVLAYKVISRASRYGSNALGFETSDINRGHYKAFNIQHFGDYLDAIEKGDIGNRFASRYSCSLPAIDIKIMRALFPRYDKGATIHEAEGSIGIMCFDTLGNSVDFIKQNWGGKVGCYERHSGRQHPAMIVKVAGYDQRHNENKFMIGAMDVQKLYRSYIDSQPRLYWSEFVLNGLLLFRTVKVLGEARGW